MDVISQHMLRHVARYFFNKNNSRTLIFCLDLFCKIYDLSVGGDISDSTECTDIL